MILENKTLEIPHLRLNDTVWDDIHYQWYEQALGGLFVAFSKRLKSKITDTNQLNDFDSCSKDLSNVHKYAECMSILMNSQMKRENEEITRNIGSFVLLGRKKRKTLEEAQMELLSEETLKMQNASNPSLAKFLTNLLLPIARPNRTLAQDYLTSVQKRLPNAGDTEFSHDSDEFESVNFLNTPYSYQFKRPIESLEAVLDEFFSVYKNFDQANGAQFSQELMQNIKIAVREASRIGVTDPNDANVKHILSPSLFSITKDEVSPKDKFLSPTLLSLQNDSNAILSIPQLLQQNGLEKDKDVWMDFIMEATGSNDIMKSIHKLDRQIARQNIRTTREIPDDIQKNYTKQAENFFNLKKNLTEKQLQMYKEFGYAFLEEHQIDFIYGPDSKERREILHFDVKNFTQLTENEKEETLRREIMEFVNVKPKVRTKRAPIIATAIIGRTLVG